MDLPVPLSPVMKKRIGLVTCEELPNLQVSDQTLIPLIEARGWSAVPVIWDDPSVDWSRFDQLLIRNPWDYFEKPAKFQAWLNQLKIPVHNAQEVLQWNFHKFYLKELAQKGVPMIPTIFYRAGESLPEIPWEILVCKPAISAGSYQTQRIARADFIPPSAGDWLIQPFLPEIQSGGEYSLIYFGGQFSHAIQKLPVEGDFRVQKQYGGRYSLWEPTKVQQAVAEKIWEALPFQPLYARVDGVTVGSEFWLMEVEMIEPDLYFEFGSQFATRLVDALMEAIKN